MTTYMRNAGFHYQEDLASVLDHLPDLLFRQDTEFTYTFENFFHPLVGELISQLNTSSIGGLFDPVFQAKSEEFFATYYSALESNVVKVDSSKAKARIDLD